MKIVPSVKCRKALTEIKREIERYFIMIKDKGQQSYKILNLHLIK